MQGAKTVLPVSKIARRTRCNWSLTPHSPAWRNPAACAPRQEQQPWHASTAAQEMPVMSKVEQMQATPARGEPDKLAIEARKTGF